MIDVIKTKHHIHIVLEYCPDGDLDDYILKNSKNLGKKKRN